MITLSFIVSDLPSIMQIAMMKAACKLALKELHRWMEPEKVMTLKFFCFHLDKYSSVIYHLQSKVSRKILVFAGQNINDNISIISRNCSRTSGCCPSHISLELSFLYVNNCPLFHLLVQCVKISNYSCSVR